MQRSKELHPCYQRCKPIRFNETTWNESQSEENFSGLGRDYLTVIVDESQSIKAIDRFDSPKFTACRRAT